MMTDYERKAKEIQQTVSLISINWFKVESNLGGIMYVSPVKGGWLVKEVQDVNTPDGRSQLSSGYFFTSSLAFIPDPNHEWFD